MFSRLQHFETACLARFGLARPAGVVQRGAFWLLLCSALLFLLSFIRGALGALSGVLAALAFSVLAVFLLILMYRWIVHRVMWTVRNRLVVTCLLMGLAPVVLFGMLTGIAAYIFSGQFATNTARAAMNETLARVRISSTVSAAPLLEQVRLHPAAASFILPVISIDRDPGVPATHAAIAAWQRGKRLRLDAPGHPTDIEAAPFLDAPPPPWLHSDFNGIVEIAGKLYLCSANAAADSERRLLDVATAPLDENNLAQMAQGLGSISILPAILGDTDRPETGNGAAEEDPGREQSPAALQRVQGGIVPPSAHFFDTRVFFSAPLPIRVWSTGQQKTAMLGVVSRPTLLYQRLFASSVGIGAVVRDALIAIAILFGLLELLAFLMAVRLSRTITRSIADLYVATTQIDRGNLGHRIHVERQDQLAALATSFNTMAGSLAGLLARQREQERVQNELEIAQEVQSNLFPQGSIHLPGFELHGICKPARTVSGDYYDFILAGEGKLCLALGDISGKGISAALLMASLHSAVRAYRFAGEEFSGEPGAVGIDGEELTGFASPGKLLALLNRHLYSSTQPEKYATLFFACYDGSTQKLTYSNGGQLPPLVLCADGSVKRLDCGGSVVGLLDGLEYEEATVSLNQGDILIAYSDGVTEPENDFGEFGEERLLEVIRRSRHQPLAAISGNAMRALRSWIGDAEQPDDITLVLARQL